MSDKSVDLIILSVLSREWLEFEGGVISGLLKQAIIQALERRMEITP